MPDGDPVAALAEQRELFMNLVTEALTIVQGVRGQVLRG